MSPLTTSPAGAWRWIICPVALITILASSSMADISAQDAKRIAMKIERSVDTGDGSELDALFDADELFARASRGMEIPNDFAEGFRRVLARGFGHRLATQIRKPGSMGAYRFLRVTGTPKAQRIFFRFTVDGGLNYHEFHLSDASGEVLITDVYVAVTGELLSDTLNRLLLKGAASIIGAKVSREEQEYIQSFDQIQKMMDAIRDGRADAAIKLHDALPASVQKLKLVMLMRLQSLAKLDDDAAYLKAIDAYQAAYPDDYGQLLFSLDSLYLKGHYRQLRKNLEALDVKVGGDPYLNMHRAMIASANGKRKQAQKLFQRCIDADPRLHPPYIGQFNLAVEDHDFEQAVQVMRNAAKHAKLNLDDEWTDPDFVAFQKSEPYRKWKAEQVKP